MRKFCRAAQQRVGIWPADEPGKLMRGATGQKAQAVLGLAVSSFIQICCAGAGDPAVDLIQSFGPANVVRSPLLEEAGDLIVREIVAVEVPAVGLKWPVAALELDPSPALDPLTLEPQALRIDRDGLEIPNEGEAHGAAQPTWFIEQGSLFTSIENEELAFVGSGEPFGGWLFTSSAVRQRRSLQTPPGVYELVVVASGTSALGVPPRVEAEVDGRVVGRAEVKEDYLRNERGTYRFPVALSRAEHVLGVKFTNDATTPGEDRNLFIHSLGLESRPGVYLRGEAGFGPVRCEYEPVAIDRRLWSAAQKRVARDLSSVSPFLKKVPIGDETRSALFAPPPTDLRFDLVVPREGRLSFGMGTLPESWTEAGDGVEFVVELNHKGKVETLFRRYIDPKHRPEERRWLDQSMDLARFAGQRVELWLRTRGTHPVDRPARREVDEHADDALWGAPVVAGRGGDQPIVILVSLDSVRADHVGAYGYERGTTPTLDQLAREGTLFERCYSQSPYTLASHMSLLTGLFPFQHGVEDTRWSVLDPTVTTFPEFLRSRGFATAAFTEGGGVSGVSGFNHGFELYQESLLYRGVRWSNDLPPAGKAVRSTFEGALRWLARSEGRPRFLFIHTYQAHLPFNPPPSNRNLFVRRESSLLPTAPVVDAINNGLTIATPQDLQTLVDLYDAELHFADETLGWFLDRLEKEGLLKRVTLIVVSDHGEALGERGQWFWHVSLIYEENLRVPFILWGRGVPRGRVAQEVRLIDLLPTGLAAIGIDSPDGVAGYAVHLREEEQSLPQRPNIAESALPDRRLVSYRVPRFTLILSLPRDPDRPTWRELYDRLYDPRETHNLAPVELELAAQLEKELRRFLESGPRARRLLGGGATLQELRTLGYVH